MKAQMSLEAIVIFGMALLIFAAVSISAMSWQMSSNAVSEYLGIRRTCTDVSNWVYYVFIFGEGSESVMRLDSGINVSNNSVYVGRHICRLCCRTTNGSSDTFGLNSGYVRVKNLHGEVVMENV
jgi:hypothetical protein